MAELRFKIEAGKDFFYVYDKTGEFDKKTNPNGWTDQQIKSITNAVIRIYLPKQETYTEVIVFPSLPRIDCVGLEIVPSDANMESFPPGVYRFDYVVTFDNGSIQSQALFFFHFQPLCCCVEKKKGKLSLTDASSTEAKKVIELQTLLDNAQYAACHGDMDGAQEINDLIWTRCGCCC